MTLKSHAKFEKKNWLLVPKMTWKIWWILIQTVSSLKNCTLMCYFCRKCIMFAPKMYRGVMCRNTEVWHKISGGTDCALQDNMGNFDPTFESLNVCTLLGSFWARYIIFELKNYRGFVMTLKGGAILTGHLINYIRQGILLIFTWVVASLKMCTLMGSFCPKRIKF